MKINSYKSSTFFFDPRFSTISDSNLNLDSKPSVQNKINLDYIYMAIK